MSAHRRGARHPLDVLYRNADDQLARDMSYKGKHRKGWWAS